MLLNEHRYQEEGGFVLGCVWIEIGTWTGVSLVEE